MELSQAMPKARVEIAHPALAMVGLMIGSFVGMFSETALNVSQGTIQWLVTGYMLVIGICMPLSSLLTKWFTTKKIVLFALGAFIVGILLSANANSSLAWVIFGHVVLMIGAPLAMSPAQTYGLNSLSGALSADGSAILNTLQQIVGAVATAIATSLIAFGSSQQAGVAGLTVGAHAGFGFVLILAVVALLVSTQVESISKK